MEHISLDAFLDQLRADGFPVLDVDVARLSPYMYAHINVHGHYSFPGAGSARRPTTLRDPDTVGEE